MRFAKGMSSYWSNRPFRSMSNERKRSSMSLRRWVPPGAPPEPLEPPCARREAAGVEGGGGLCTGAAGPGPVGAPPGTRGVLDITVGAGVGTNVGGLGAGAGVFFFFFAVFFFFVGFPKSLSSATCRNLGTDGATSFDFLEIASMGSIQSLM